MRSPAEVDEPVVAIGGDLLASAHLALIDVLDDLQFELVVREHVERLFTGHGHPLEGLILGDYLRHPGLDLFQVLGGEGLGDLEVVVEAVLDRRADGEGGAGEQVEHRLRHHVGRRVPEDVQALGAVQRDDFEVSTLVDGS